MCEENSRARSLNEPAVRTVPAVTRQVALEFALTLEEEVGIRILLDPFTAVRIHNHQLECSRLISDFATLEADEQAFSFEKTDHRKVISVVTVEDLIAVVASLACCRQLARQNLVSRVGIEPTTL